MALNILVIGSTGNTGKSVVQTLHKILEDASSTYNIIGLTRFVGSGAAQELARLPRVTMIQKDWTLLEPEWLISQRVERAYVASHNLPHQYQDESHIHIALLKAGVKYVVRLSTDPCFMGPTSPVYYGRTHWAIEKLLEDPDFKEMQWVSLRANVFSTSWLQPVVAWIKEFQKTGEKQLLRLIHDAKAPIAMVDPADVGRAAAHLLAVVDPTPHNHARYMINGPEDVNGETVVDVAEKYAGTKIDKVEYQDETFMAELIKYGYSQKELTSIRAGIEIVWGGNSSTSNAPTSDPIIELAPPTRSIRETLEVMMQEQ